MGNMGPAHELILSELIFIGRAQCGAMKDAVLDVRRPRRKKTGGNSIKKRVITS